LDKLLNIYLVRESKLIKVLLLKVSEDATTTTTTYLRCPYTCPKIQINDLIF